MTEIKQSLCALCDTPAQFEHHDGNPRRYYECTRCHYYAISERAVRHLRKHPESKPALAKEAAGMPHETQILKITWERVRGLSLAKGPAPSIGNGSGRKGAW